MKNKKIFSIIIYGLLIFLILNTFIALISYQQVCDKRKPTVSFGVSKTENKTIYKELLYNVTLSEDDGLRTVSLKLFFLK